MTSLLAAVGLNPADVVSPLNLVLLISLFHVGARFLGEMGQLRRLVVQQAEELARTAKGSEERAEDAAAEIARLSARAEETLAAITAIGASVRDRLALLKVENDIREV